MLVSYFSKHKRYSLEKILKTVNHPRLDNQPKTIFRFDGTFPMEPAASTSFIHDGVTMTEYQNEPFIVGDYNHNQVEFMHLSHEKWYTASPVMAGSKWPHPFEIQRIFGYAVVSRPGKVFLLGGSLYYKEEGRQEHTMGQILLYQNDNWEPLGGLVHSRMNFMTITYGTDVMIIGGKYEAYDNDLSTEIELFSLIDKTESDLEQSSVLTNMVLPNAMFFNGISIILDDVSTCQETKIGMNIKI